MKCRTARWLAILLLFLGFPPSGAAHLLGDNLVGSNIGGVRYWSREHKFIDQMKTSEPWRVQATGVWDTGETPDLDANGWVQSIPPDRQVAALILRDAEEHWPHDDSGDPITDWVVTYNGVGTFDVDLSGGCQITNPTPGRFEITNCIPSGGGINFIITSVGAPNHPTDIRIVPPAYENEDTDTDTVFFPYLVDELSKYSGPLRLLDFMRVNTNDQVTDWATSPKVTDAKQTSPKGAALEYAVKLANDTMRDLWVTVPYLATTNWVLAAAYYLKVNLHPDLKVIVEYSNEVWNSDFPVHAYTQQKAIEDEICTPLDPAFQCGLFWYAKHSNLIHDLFERRIGASRLIRLHAGQASNDWVGAQVLGYDNTWQKTEVFAIAPYFCRDLGSEDPPSATEPAYDEVHEVLAYCRDVDIPTETFIEVENNKALVDSYGQGIELWAYEGGQHLVGIGNLQADPAVIALFTAANRDGRMREVYKKYFRGIFQRGIEIFANYTTVTDYDEWGSWGIREFDDQTRKDSPKYDAVMCMLEDGNRDGDSFPDCIDSLSVPSPLPATSAPALIGLSLLMAVGAASAINRGRGTAKRG